MTSKAWRIPFCLWCVVVLALTELVKKENWKFERMYFHQANRKLVHFLKTGPTDLHLWTSIDVISYYLKQSKCLMCMSYLGVIQLWLVNLWFNIFFLRRLAYLNSIIITFKTLWRLTGLELEKLVDCRKLLLIICLLILIRFVNSSSIPRVQFFFFENQNNICLSKILI